MGLGSTGRLDQPYGLIMSDLAHSWAHSLIWGPAKRTEQRSAFRPIPYRVSETSTNFRSLG